MELETDQLTGLPTFAGLRPALGEPAAAIFLDVDGLRFVNHQSGHLAGDDVLAAIGAWLKKEAAERQGLAFRVAGDEFILLLPGRTLDDAVAIAGELVAAQLRTVTLSAVVFLADRNLPDNLRGTLESFAEKLYQRELAGGRAYGNVVTA
jgi:GGDEF domain-containing protein